MQLNQLLTNELVSILPSIVPVLAVLRRLRAAAGRVGVQHRGASTAHQGRQHLLSQGGSDAARLERLIRQLTQSLDRVNFFYYFKIN